MEQKVDNICISRQSICESLQKFTSIMSNPTSRNLLQNEYLVCGYVRDEFENADHYLNIPNDIKQICLLFYHIQPIDFHQYHNYLTENDLLDLIKQSSVIHTMDFMLWKMDKVWELLNGPLLYENYFRFALCKTKFFKRLIRYLKPSKQFFCLFKYTSSYALHAQCAAQTFRLLTKYDDFIKNPSFIQLIEEIFDCLKDKIVATDKPPNTVFQPFIPSLMKNTFCSIYIKLIGILSETERGLKLLSYYDIFTLLKSIKLNQETNIDYLLREIAMNLDYTKSEQLRLIFSTWIVDGSYYFKKCLLYHLKNLYKTQRIKNIDQWIINILTALLQSDDERIALTALNVMENMNILQHSVDAQEWFINLINMQTSKHSIIAKYGQFSLIKILSTRKGVTLLQSSKWLNDTTEQWIQIFHQKYTKFLEMILKENNNHLLSNNEWISYYSINKNASNQQPFYDKYLEQFPWSLDVIIQFESGRSISILTDTFYDENCFDSQQNAVSFGYGIHGILNRQIIHSNVQKIRIKLNIGHECLNDLYEKELLTKDISINIDEMVQTMHDKVVNKDELYLFFEYENADKSMYLCRVFWSLNHKTISPINALFIIKTFPHFYDSLCQTQKGCKYIVSQIYLKSYLQKCINTVHQRCNQIIEKKPENDDLVIEELKTCVWCIGIVGSSSNGLNLLNNLCENDNINSIYDICVLAKQSQTLSIGTVCLHALHLISNTKNGINQLHKYGFISPDV